MSSIITHEIVYDTLIKEKTRAELQKIEEPFLAQLNSYISEKELILSSQKQKNSFPEEIKKTEKQLESIKLLSTELTERRKRKILDLALLNSRTSKEIPPPNLLPNEKTLYTSVLDALRIFSSPPRKPKTKTLKNENPQICLVKFLHPVPKFVGTDTKVYGPFNPSDTIELPIETANLLIKKQKAEKIKDEITQNQEKIL